MNSEVTKYIWRKLKNFLELRIGSQELSKALYDQVTDYLPEMSTTKCVLENTEKLDWQPTTKALTYRKKFHRHKHHNN